MSTETAPGLSLGQGLTLWLAVIPVLAGYAAIAYALDLGLAQWAGFLFIWYFSSVDKVDFALLPQTVAGALAGVGTAWLLQYAAATWGGAGGLAVLGLIVIALLVQIMNWLPLIVNAAYMLYLTVAAMPLLQVNQVFADLALALVLGVVYFAGVIWLGLRVFAMVRKAPAVVVPEAASE